MNSSKPTTYKVLMDWWLLIPVGFLLVCLVLMIPALTYLSLSIQVQVVASLLIIITVLYIVDTAFFTYYQLEKENLIVVSQLRHLEFPYRDMREVRPIGLKGLFSWRSRKRFSLSLHAYQIILRKGAWKSITISPAERDIFINQLTEHVDQERSRRVTIHKK